MRIQLTRRATDGTTEQIDLTHKPGNPVKTTALKGARVELSIDGQPIRGGEVVDGKKLSLRKSGKNLQILLGDEEVAAVDGFYDAPGAVLSGESWSFSDAGGAASAQAAVTPAGVIPDLPAASAAGSGDFNPAWLGLGVLAAGGGGGGGAAVAAATSTFSLNIAAAAGPVISALNYRVETAAGVLVVSGTTSATGTATSIAVPTQPAGTVLVIKLSDANGAAPDYKDEATNTNKNLGLELHAAFVSVGANGSASITVSPVTELAYRLAVRMAGGNAANVTTAIAEAANEAVGQALGLVDGNNKSTILGPVATVLDATYNEADGLSAAEKYAQVLAKLSGLDDRNGQVDATLTALLAQFDSNGTLSAAGTQMLADGAAIFESSANGSLATLNAALSAPSTFNVSAAQTARQGGALSDNAVSSTEAASGITIPVAIAQGMVANDTITLTLSASGSGTTQTVTYTVTAADVSAGFANVAFTQAQLAAAGEGSKSITAQATHAGGTPLSLTVAGFSLDLVAPTVSTVALTSATGAQANTLNAGDTVTATVTFSEAVVVTGAPQLALNIGGSIVQASYAAGSGSNTLTFTYTIQAGQTDANGIAVGANALSLNGGTIKDASGNVATLTHAAVADNASYAIDTTAPTLTITDSEAAATATGPVAFTLTFSEAVTGFDASKLSLTGGTLGGLTQVNATTYSVVATPNANASGTLALTVSNTGITDAAGNALAAPVAATQAYNTVSVTPDTTAPTLNITDSEPAATGSGPVTFTLVFSEPVTGLDASKLSLTGGTLGSLTQINATTYSVVATPTANASGTLALTVDNTGIADLAGNALAAPGTASQAYNTVGAVADTTPPTLSISDNISAATAGGPVTFTFDFSEAVSGFDVSKIAVSGGTAGTLTQLSATQYSLVVTPNANATGTMSVSVAAGAVQDLAGNALPVAVSASQAYDTTVAPTDTVAPTLTITDSEPSATATGPVTFTLTFSEAVNGFDASKLSLTGGTLGSLTQINATTYSVVATPTANASGTLALTVANTGIADLAGNALAAPATASQAYNTVAAVADTTPPTLTITDSEPAGTATGPVTFTLTFSEAITGLSASKLSLAGGTLGALTQVNATTYTVVATPTANTTGTMALTVANAGIVDLAGNPLAAPVTASQAYNTVAAVADTTPPTLSITDNIAGATAGGPVTFTFNFSEAVSGFDISKIAVSGGAAGTLTQLSATQYSLVVTPTANTTGTMGVSVAAGAVRDLAGNALAGAASGSQAYDTTTPPSDTVAPTLTVTDSEPAATATGPVTFTLTFSEAVNGFDASKLSLTGGTLGSLTQVNATTYSVVATPTANASGTLALTVANTGIADLAGNALAAPATASQAYNTVAAVADTTPPTLSITDNIAGATAGGPVTFTFNFSEAVSGFDISKIAVSGGTAGTLTQLSATQYSLVVTPNANANSTMSVSVAAGAVHDLAGNALTSAVSASQAYDTTVPPSDTVAPTLAITDSEPAATATGPVTFTLTFSEAVNGFDVSKLSLTGGTLGSLTQVNATTYSVVATPTANASGTLALTVANTGITDLAGNALAAPATASQAYNTVAAVADTTPPTLTITDNIAAATAGGPVTFTFNFSEPVSGFDISKVAVSGGTAGTLTQLSATQYSLVVTPNANANSTMSVSVAAGAVHDLAGNALTSAVSASQAYDTTVPPSDTIAPTLAITDSEPAATATGPVTFTLTFSEAVNGFDVSKLSLTGGTLGSLTQVNATTYSVVATPTANASGTLALTVANTGITDLAGNALAAPVTVSQAYNTVAAVADTTPPTLTITDSEPGASATGPVTFTLTFSEPVAGFDAGKLHLTGGTLGSLTQVNATTYSVVATPRSNASGTLALTVANTGIADLAGNALAAPATASQAYNTVGATPDTTPPAAPVLTLGTGVTGGATAAEATQAGGVVLVNAEYGSALVVTFTQGANSVVKRAVATGSAQAITLDPADLVTLGNGSVAVSAVATDASGNASSAGSTSFTLDTSAPAAPVLTLGSGVADGASSTEATAASGVVTVNAESGSSVVVTFTQGANTVSKTVTGTGSAQAVTLTAADLTTLGDGSVSVSAVATDAAGNASSAGTTTFTLDATAPATPVLALGTGVSNGATSAEATAAGGVVTVNAESGASVAVTFTRGANTVTKTVTGTGSAQAVTLTAADLTTLGDGTISVSAIATDAAGNASSAGTTTFTLDAAAPATPVLALGSGVAGGATSAEATAAGGVVTVNAESGANVEVTFTQGANTVTKTVTGTGAAQAVTLTAADLTALGDGTISVSAVATDAAGNASSAGTTTFTLDTAAPATPVLALGTGVSNGATSTEATAAGGVVTVSAESGASIVVTFTQGANTVSKTVTGTGSAQAVTLTAADLTTLGDGTISVSAIATDAAGNASSAGTTTFTLDAAAPATPVLALGSGVAGGATSAEATAAGGVVTVNAESGANVEVTFTQGANTVTKTVTGTGSAQAVTLTAADLTALGDGTVSVSAVATDAAGNASSAGTTTFTLDTAAPATPVLALGTGVSNGATSTEATAAGGVITVSAESGASVEVTFTQGANTVTKTVTGTGSAQAVALTAADLTALGDGTISVSAVATDAAGNASGAGTTTFTLDTAAPATPVLALGTGVSNGATAAEATAAGGVVTVSGESGASIAVTFTQGANTVSKTVTGTGSAQAVTLTAADLTTLGDGSVSVSAVATDAAGNASSAGTTTFTLDAAAPATPVLALGTGVAGGATSAEATAAGGVVTVSAESGASIVVTFTQGANTVSKTVTGMGSAQAVTLTAADLTTLGDGSVSVSAVATDAAGNASSAGTTTFTLDTAAPATPVLALGTGVSNGATSAEATAAGGVVTVSGEAGSSIAVTFTRGANTVSKTVTGTGSAQAVTLTAADLTTLGDGSVSVSAVATDAAGNASSAGTTTFTLDTAAPATPVLALGTGVTGGATSAEATAAGGVVTVNAESGASIVVTFTQGANTVSKTVTGTGSAQAVTLTAADLTTLGDGTISVSAVATDVAGNASSAGTTTFTLDTAAPATPVLALGTGVSNGATSAEATAAGGVVTVNAESGASVAVTFTQGANTVTKTVTGTGSAQAVTLTAADLTTLGDGTISVSAVATDAAGNVGSAGTTSFTLDTTAPATPVLVLGTGVSNGATSAEATAAGGVVTVSGEAGSSIAVTFTRGANTLTKTVTGTGSAQAVTLTAADLTTLGDGSVSVSAVATDAAGNASSAGTTSFTLDTVALAPVLALGTGVAGGATSAEATAAGGVVTVNAESGASVVVTLTRGANTVTKTVTGTGSAQAVTLTAADLTTLGDGTISVSAVQTDSAGNVSSAGTTSFTLDTVAPTAPVLALGTGVSNGATVAEATAAGGVVTVSGESGASIAVTFTQGANTVTKTVTGTGSAQAVTLTAADLTTLGDGAVNVSAVVTDAAGNASTAGTTSFTLDTVALAPTVALGTGVSDGANRTEATQSSGVVTVSGESGANITVTLTRGSNTLTRTLTGTGSAQAVALSATDLSQLGDGTVNVSAVQTDTAGNTSSAGTNSFTLDSTAPSVSSVTISGFDSSNVAKSTTLGVGDKVRVTLALSEAVTLTGTPSFTLQMGSTAKQASYVAGSSTSTSLVFEYVITSGDNDASGGIESWTNALSLGAGSAVDAVGNAFNLTLPAVGVGGNAVSVLTTAPAQTIAIASATDNVGVLQANIPSGRSTDDTTLVLNGTISAALGSNDSIVIYDNGTRVGSVTTTTGSSAPFSWTFATATLSSGLHSFTARVENSSTSLTGAYSTAFTEVVHASVPAITLVSDAVGAVTGSVAASGSTDDARPTLSGTLAAGLQSGEVLQVYDGSTLLGEATVSGTTWSFRPSSALADGSHTFQVALQSATGNALASANMVSSTFAITVNTATPSATASITGVTDNVNTNGSVGTTGTPVTVTSGTSTDDTTPTLSGTVSAALGSGEVVAIYDTVGGVSTRLGTATVTSTTWTYTPSALSAGSHSFTARVENPTSGASTAASSAWVTTIHSGLSLTMTDDVGATQGTVAAGGTTDDNQPTFSGTLSVALGSNEQLSIYNGSTRVGVATVNGLSWTFTPASALADGSSYAFAAVVEDATTGTLATGRVISTSSALTISTAAPTTTASITNVTDNINTNGSVGTTGTPVTIATGTSTDDTTPTLSGTVSTALGTGEVLAIYDTMGGVTTKLANVTFAGTSWTYTPSALSVGSHSFTARVENTASGAVSTTSSAWVTTIHSGLNFTMTDDVGATQGTVVAGGTTDDNRPTFSGTLSVALGSNEQLSVYNGSTRVGVATVSGLNWTFTPASALADGSSYVFRAVVEDATTGTLATGRVISTSSALTINTVVPTATASITGVTDNVNTNGSVGTTGTPVTIATGTSTDDTTPTLSGTVSAALGTSQIVAIYDTINGVSTKLGNATVSGTTWTYTPSALSAGSHSFTARVESTASGASTATSSAWATNIHSGLSFTMTDDVGITQGTVAAGDATDDNQPTLSGTLSTVLGSGEQLSIYNGSTRLGVATVNGLNWNFTPATALADGSYSLTAVVEDATTGTLATGRVISATSAITINTATPTATASITNVTDNVNTNGSVGTTGTPVTIATGTSTDDTTPTLSGTVSAALGTGHVVAIYDTVGGVTTKLGNATVSGTTWTYTPSALNAGSHSFMARVENSSSGTFSSASSAWVINIYTGLTFSALDDVGATQGTVIAGGTIDDNLPTFSGTLSVALGSNERLSIYNGSNRVGVATVNGLSWTFTPSSPFSDSVGYNFTARIEDVTTGSFANTRVASATLNNLTISANTTITATASITNVTDNANTNGSVGTTGTPVTIATGTSTDDTTPTLSGTVSAALGTGLTVAIYDTINGVTIKLGNATVSGTTWTYTPTALNAGGHSFTARVENVSNGAAGASSTAWAVNVYSGLSFAMNDDVGATQGVVASGGATDDNTPTLSGTLTGAMGSGEELAIYDTVNGVTTRIGAATVSGTSWSFTPGTALADGIHNFQAVVQPTGTTSIGLGEVISSASTLTVVTTTPTATASITGVTDNLSTNGSVGSVSAPVAVASGTSTDDTTPTLSGTVSAALATGQVVGIYDTVGGVTTKLGNATVAGTTWTYTPSALSAGSHSFTARVENLAGSAASASSAAWVANIHSGLSFAMNDDMGATQGVVASGGATDDNTPTLSGTLTAAIGSGEELAVYDTVNGVTTRIGAATVSGTSWSFTPGTALADGVHSFQAVVQPTGTTNIALGEVISSASTLTVATTTPTATASITGVTDNVSTNGSVGLVSAPVAVASGTSTDDTTPTLSGTVSAALAAGQVVGIYDTVDGVTTKLGNATVAGTTWTYTPSALSAGSHSFTAKVENPGSGVGTAASAAWVTNVHSGLTFSVIDDVGSVQGIPGQALGTFRYVLVKQTGASSNEFYLNELEAYVGGVNVALGKTVTAGAASYGGFPVSGVTDGVYSRNNGYAGSGASTANWVMVDLGGAFTVDTVRLYALSTGDLPQLRNVDVFLANQDISGLTYAQLLAGFGGAVRVSGTGASPTYTVSMTPPLVPAPIDDNTPTLSGTLTAAIGSGEELAIYDTVNGVTTRIGAATVSGTSWSFTPGTALADGVHSFQAVVQPTGTTSIGLGEVISGVSTLTVVTTTPTATASITGVTDNLSTNGSVGSVSAPVAVASGTSTDDTTPTLSGTVSAALATGQVVGIYDTVGGVTTKLGNATVIGTTWTYTPSALSAGSHSFTARVENAAGSAASASSAAWVANIHNGLSFAMNDDVGATQGVVASGGATDDNTPTLSGTLTAAIGSGEELAIYDTVNGVTTRIGAATVSGTSWSFTPGTALADGVHSLQAVVQPTGTTNIALGEVISSASTLTVATTTPTATASITGVTDNLSTNGSVGSVSAPVAVASGTSTDDTTPTLSGTVSAALATGQVVGIYDTVGGVTTKLGNATVAGTTWTYTPSTLSAGSHSFTAKVENPGSGVGTAASTAWVVNIHSGLSFAMNDDVGATQGVVASGGATDDNTPTLSGTLTAAIGSGEELAIYDTVNGATTRIGAATVSGTSWSFTPGTALADGAHSFQAVVQPTGTTSIGLGEVISSASTLTVVTTTPTATASITGVTDNLSTNGSVGSVSAPVAVASGTSTDDTTPTLSGTVSAALATGQVVGIYDTVGGVTTKLGNATVAGTTWTYTPSALSAGSHSFTARVENLAGSAASASSAAWVANVHSGLTFSVTDDVGSAQGIPGQALGTFRYVLVKQTGASSNEFYLNELEAYVGGVNVALGKTVTAGAASYGGFPVSGVTDGVYSRNNGYAGLGASTANWVLVDLGGAFTVDAISLYALSTGDLAQLRNVDVFLANQDISGLTYAQLLAGFGGAVRVSGTGASPTYTVSMTPPLVIAPIDDTTPTLSGTLTAAIGSGEELAIYDTVNGVTTRIGAATVSGTSWSFTPGTALADGAHSFQAVVQPTGTTSIGLGEVISSASTLTVATTTPTATASITGVTDNLSTNGSVGSVSAPVAVASGTSTDDTTPTLSGTVSAALATGQVVGIYDTVGGVTTKLGNATVAGTTWTYTPSALSAGSHSFTAKVENPGSGVGTAASTAWAINIHSGLSFAMNDDVGAITGNLLQTTQPASSRYVRVEIGAGLGSLNEVQAWAWVNGTLTNVAAGKSVVAQYAAAQGSLANLVDGSGSSSYTANTSSSWWVQIDLGQNYNVQSVVLNGGSGSATVRTSANDMSKSFWTAAADTTAQAQAVTLVSGVSASVFMAPVSVSDDSTPALAGTLAAALGSGEVLAVWDGSTRLGTATVSGTNWSYTPSGLSAGSHSLFVQVESAGGQALAISNTFGLTVDGTAPTQSALITGVINTQNGAVSSYALSSGGLADDHPLLSGIVGIPSLAANQQVAIYDGATRLGYATVSGSSWSFYVQPGQLSAGTHSLTAVVENTATGAKGTASSAFAIDVQSINLSTITDDVGAWTGNVLSRGLSYVDGSGVVTAANGGTTVTDDSTPTLAGTLGHALGGSQVLAVYDGGTLLGNATVSGTSWSFTSSALSTGTHSLSFQIENTSVPGASLMKTGTATLNIVAASAELSNATASSVLSVNNAGLVDLTAVSGAQQPTFNKVTLGASGVSGITLKLDTSDVLGGTIAQFVSSQGTAVGSDGRTQVLIDGTTATSNTVNVADTGWSSMGTTTISGKTYAVYNHDTTAQLLIDTLLTRTGGVL